MTGYESKRAAAQDKLDNNDLTIAYQSGYYDGKKAAQPAQEPVAWQFMNGSTFRKRRPEDFSDLAPDGFPYWKPLYTTLPVAKRPWVDLTDEDIEDLFQSAANADEETHIRFARAIETALRSKNNG